MLLNFSPVIHLRWGLHLRWEPDVHPRVTHRTVLCSTILPFLCFSLYLSHLSSKLFLSSCQVCICAPYIEFTQAADGEPVWVQRVSGSWSEDSDHQMGPVGFAGEPAPHTPSVNLFLKLPQGKPIQSVSKGQPCWITAIPMLAFYQLIVLNHYFVSFAQIMGKSYLSLTCFMHVLLGFHHLGSLY